MSCHYVLCAGASLSKYLEHLEDLRQSNYHLTVTVYIQYILFVFSFQIIDFEKMRFLRG